MVHGSNPIDDSIIFQPSVVLEIKVREREVGGGSGWYSSVDSSAPTILLSQVRIPNTPSTLMVKNCTTFVIVLIKERKRVRVWPRIEAKDGQF